jgi:amidase
MRTTLLLSLLCTTLPLHAAESWLLKLERWGNPSYMTLHLQDDGGRLSGTLDGDRLTGVRGKNSLRFTVTDKDGKRYEYSAATGAGGLTGSADFPRHQRCEGARPA